MYRHRIVELAKDRRFRYILLFKNKGAEAGASIDHPHSQLIAIPTVPKRVKEEIDGARAYFDFKERCVYCDMIKQEITDGRRVIFENRGFLAFEPFASRLPVRDLDSSQASRKPLREHRQAGDCGAGPSAQGNRAENPGLPERSAL
jgi:galactose-1-phosphate uridylyltransferase